LELPGSDVDEQAQAFLDRPRQEPGWANDSIRQYILEHRKRVDSEQITAGRLKGLFTPIKMFCDGYDDVSASINWKRIKKVMPSPQQYADDRAYSLEEIKKLLDYPDRRLRSIVLIMASSGMRVGGFEGLKLKHIREIPNNNTNNEEGGRPAEEVIAAHLHVAKNKGGRPYNTFISGECYKEVKKYMDWRKMWGEKITGESWVIRDDFVTADTKRNPPTKENNNNSSSSKGGLNRRADTPRQLKVQAINRLVVRALYEQGLRETLEVGQKRHSVRGCHGFRKYFFSRASLSGVHGLTLEMFMGHKLPDSLPSYMKPTPEEFRDAYLSVMPAITIYQSQQDVEALKKQIEEKDNNKDREIEELRAQMAAMNARIEKLIENSYIKAISNEYRVRELRGNPVKGNLSMEEVENIKNWDDYEDYFLEAAKAEEEKREIKGITVHPYHNAGVDDDK